MQFKNGSERCKLIVRKMEKENRKEDAAINK
jgi:hypothetical protein